MHPTPERVIADDDSLSLLQKVLLTTDGTVTQLLEIYTGEKIRVEKLEHTLVTGGPASLGVSATEPVLSRRILLRGATRPYMYAHSWLVPSRMPRGMQETILQTDTPIGQLWKASPARNVPRDHRLPARARRARLRRCLASTARCCRAPI